MPVEDIEIDDPHHPTKKRALKWKRKTRVMILCSRKVAYLSRHLTKNLSRILPHSKTDCKFDRKKGLTELNEIAEMKNCNKVMYFEAHKVKDVYLYMVDTETQLTAIFLLHNVCTMEQLKLTGNSLKTSRAVLSFTPEFDKFPHLSLYKEMFVSIFSTPFSHPKSQPFIDHVFTFSVVDGRIWFRNYQILQNSSGLAEIGPRFVMEPIKIMNGSFQGEVIYKNPKFKTPSALRSMVKHERQQKSYNRLVERVSTKTKKQKKGQLLNFDPDADFIFADE